MIDLHLHYDGSLLPRTVIELADEQGVALPTREPDELKLFMAAPPQCADLNEYLDKFDLPLSILQSFDGVRKAVRTLAEQLKEQGMLYAELRIAPQSHTKKGMTQKQVVVAALTGMQDALVGSFFKAKLILCCMRGADNQKENMETVRLAAEYMNWGVCAVDLAGAEALFPTEDYKDVFALAKRLGVPYTIHAGEADGPESVWAAVEMGASRIGHGVRAGEDPRLLEEIKKRNICLEMCPSSNVQTHAVESMDRHPILDYLHKGVKVTVNTDNMTVSDTTIEKEFSILEKELGMTPEDKLQLLLNAADSAFISAEEKWRLKDVIKKVMTV